MRGLYEMILRKGEFVAAVLIFTTCGVMAFGQGNGNGQGNDNQGDQGQDFPGIIKHRPNPHGAGSVTTGSIGPVTPLITNHGGPVIGTPNIYFIWYGNWNQSDGSDTPAGQQILRDFANNIGTSSYFAINSSYPGVSGNASFKQEATDNYSQGRRLHDSSVLAVVSHAINNNLLPYDANGVYFVLTSSDVAETSGFCSQYCGWHYMGNISTPSGSKHVRYSFVGNANRCLNACAEQTTSPNGNAGVDAMASVVAHELEESTTDPDVNAWYDSNGAENGDKCAWTFGHNQFQVANGSWANMTLGSRNFLIQRNLWQSSTTDYCYVSIGVQ